MRAALTRPSRRAFILGAAVLAVAPPCVRAATDPTAYVRSVGEQAVSVLRDGALDRAAKVDRLRGLMRSVLDLETVGRLVLAKNWRTATPEQQARFVALTDAIITGLLAEQIARYRGHDFAVAGSRPAGGEDMMVATRIVTPDQPQGFAVEWRVRPKGEGWVVVDVVVEGVSMVVTRRSEAAGTIASRGIDGLLTDMEGWLARQPSPGPA